MSRLDLGYSFKRGSLLATALTHSTYLTDHKNAEDNQRLEFLGDSVLGCVVARELFLRHPEMKEGELTRLRAAYICESSLAKAAESLGVGEQLRFGKRENPVKLRRPSVLADAFEAILAAIYLDGGWEPAAAFIEKTLLSHPPEVAVMDYKTRLQEKTQAQGIGTPSYQLLGQSGPEHELMFECACLIGEAEAGRGKGHSKKAAEQEAAKTALESIL